MPFYSFSQGKSAQDLFDTLHSENPEEISKSLKKLAKAASDITFATEFIDKKGHELLIKMVEAGTEWVDGWLMGIIYMYKCWDWFVLDVRKESNHFLQFVWFLAIVTMCWIMLSSYTQDKSRNQLLLFVNTFTYFCLFWYTFLHNFILSDLISIKPRYAIIWYKQAIFT